MNDGQLYQMINLLADRTTRGVVKWFSIGTSDAYYTTLPSKNTVTLSSNSSQTMQFLDVLDVNGVTVTSANSTQISELSGLFDLAKRSALGSDKVLGEIIADLEGK